MNLNDLDVLFDESDLDFDSPTPDQLYTIYGIFLDHFYKMPLVLNGKQVKINTNPSKHPLFRNKHETFVHIITRDNKYNNKRQYDRDRANRIHWIRPILENCQSSEISYFARPDERGNSQHYYWYQQKEFIVILREVIPDLLLLTAFCVDSYNKMLYRKYLSEYRNKRK